MKRKHYFQDNLDGGSGKPKVQRLVFRKKDANLVSSDVGGGMHSPVLDIDFPCRLVPSSTPGHYHLYLDGFGNAVAEVCKVYEYAGAIRSFGAGLCYVSIKRRRSCVRLPHIKKIKVRKIEVDFVEPAQQDFFEEFMNDTEPDVWSGVDDDFTKDTNLKHKIIKFAVDRWGVTDMVFSEREWTPPACSRCGDENGGFRFSTLNSGVYCQKCYDETPEERKRDLEAWTKGEFERSRAPENETLFQRAEQLVNGNRNDDYGKAEDNFSNIAKAWSGIIQGKLNEDITASDVALLMTALKLVREGNKHTEDSLVDAAGYLILADRLSRPSEALNGPLPPLDNGPAS